MLHSNNLQNSFTLVSVNFLYVCFLCLCLFAAKWAAKEQSLVLVPRKGYNKYSLLDSLGFFSGYKEALLYLLFHSTLTVYWGLKNHFHLWLSSGSPWKTTFAGILLQQHDKFYHQIPGRLTDRAVVQQSPLSLSLSLSTGLTMMMTPLSFSLPTLHWLVMRYAQSFHKLAATSTCLVHGRSSISIYWWTNTNKITNLKGWTEHVTRGLGQDPGSALCPHSCFCMNSLWNHLTSQNWDFPHCKMGRELTQYQQVTSQLEKHGQVWPSNPFHPVNVGPSDKQHDANQEARSQAADEWETHASATQN